LGLFNLRRFPLLTAEEGLRLAEKAAAKKGESQVDQLGFYGEGVESYVYGVYTPSRYPRLIKMEKTYPSRAMVEGDRYTLLRGAESSFFSPEEQRVVVLNGEIGRTAEGFLQYILKDIKLHGLGLMVDLDDYLRAAARLHFPTRYFQRGLYDLELRHAHPAATTYPSIRETILASQASATPIELVYPTKNGAPTVRQVVVRSARQEYFTAEHQRGVRRYRYDRVISSLRLIGLAKLPLVETPTLVIEWNSTEIRVTFMGLTEYIGKLKSGYYDDSANRVLDEKLSEISETLTELNAQNKANKAKLERIEKELS